VTLAITLIYILAGTRSAVAEPAAAAGVQPMPLEDRTPVIQTFLDDEGRVDLRALRRSGYTGTIDLSGLDLRLDGENGTPIVRPESSSALRAEGDEHWWAGFGNGVNGEVRCLASHEGDLIVGGDFTSACGVEAERIARWDGHGWHPLGDGFDDRVDALGVHEGRLIAGGLFEQSGQTVVNHIARWDGEAWQPMGLGMSGPGLVWVDALAVHAGYLVAGGWFERANTAVMNNIARWDGDSWRHLDTGLDGGAPMRSLSSMAISSLPATSLGPAAPRPA
jgi:hypothetical protein